MPYGGMQFRSQPLGNSAGGYNNVTGVTGVPTGSQTVSGNFQTNFGVGASATGPALVLLGLVAFLVLDYVWTKNHQGGR